MKFTHGLQIIALLVLSTAIAQAQNIDTSAYSIQRAKVNELLSQRNEQFGKYGESLQRKSGIFGWQTKTDVKQSAEILRQIVVQDEEIFKQLKIMFDYKDIEKQLISNSNTENQDALTQHMGTINKLQLENKKLQLENSIQQKQSNMVMLFTLMFAGLSAVLGFIAFKKK